MRVIGAAIRTQSRNPFTLHTVQDGQNTSIYTETLDIIRQTVPVFMR